LIWKIGDSQISRKVAISCDDLCRYSATLSDLAAAAGARLLIWKTDRFLVAATLDSQHRRPDPSLSEVRAAERVPKSKKLMKVTVFTGDEERTIVAGIATKYTPEELVGRKIVIVATFNPPN
jgi:tRNA-binding EMAP/Myf-like protein